MTASFLINDALLDVKLVFLINLSLFFQKAFQTEILLS